MPDRRFRPFSIFLPIIGLVVVGIAVYGLYELWESINQSLTSLP